MSEDRPCQYVRCEVAEFVATVTLDRPPVNAFSPEMQQQIIDTFDRLSDDPAVRAVILTGAGKVFSAGADTRLRLGKKFGFGERWEYNRTVRESFHAIVECKKPVVAAVNGPALGGGLALVASCDILVASHTAQLGLPEIGIGLLGGARHAQRLFSHSLLRRMVLTGYRVSADELYRLGIIEASLDSSDLMPTAMGFARDVASKSPAAIRLAKRTLNLVEEMTLRDGYRFEQDMTAELGQHPDSREAMLAAREGRAPRFD